MNTNELITVIVNFGEGSKVLRKAKEHGVHGGTIFLGRGTVKSKVLQFLALDDIRKEIVLMVAPASMSREVSESLSKEFDFPKKNHGICFTRKISQFIGGYREDLMAQEEEKVESMYHIISVIVDRGKGQLVVDAATDAGSRGATIINARGSGIHETSKVFSIEIEPEKEVVVILSKKDTTSAIVESINKALDISKPGAGILYVQETVETYGIF